MHIPADTLAEAQALIEAAYPNRTVCLTVEYWRHVYSDRRSKPEFRISIAVFELDSVELDFVERFTDADDLLTWAKTGATAHA